jgi:NAD(P)-dependent dehydrogenase (short-subunit alcohol dehydrogenase family)
VLEKEALAETASRVEAELGTVTSLVNGAGGNRAEATTGDQRSFFDLPKEAVQWVFDLNFIGTFLPSQTFGRQMADAGAGQIINISSMNAFCPLTRIPAYSAAKSAVSNFTQWLAVHMNQTYGPDIRVNAIAPGFFLTEQNRFLLTDKDSGELTPRGRTIIDHTPMGRFGDPEDLVGTLLWLLSESSQFVNGVIIPVDGGFSAFSGV